MKQIIKRRKQKFTKLYRLAKRNECSLSSYFSAFRNLQEYKALQRKKRKYGFYLNWVLLESEAHFLHVPIYSKKDHSLLGVQAYFDKAELPADKKHLWVDT